MIDKGIEVLITKTFINKTSLHQGENEWADDGGSHKERWTYYDLPYIQKHQLIYKD